MTERTRLPNRHASETLPGLAVIYETTDNNLDGQPWPPDGNDLWCVVERGQGVMHWRRIALMEITRVVLAASDARSVGGTTEGSRAMTQENEPQSKNIATRSSEVENIHAAAQEDTGFEKILKFKKGDYFIDEEIIPLGTEFVAHAVGWTKSWIKFVDGEVAERKMYRVAAGGRPPEREELDDLDQDKWPEGLDGNPADPWVYQYLLPLEYLSSGEVVIFVTPSFGGRRAVADLCSAYAKRTKKVNNCGQPIVKLAKTEMPTKKFGKVPRPLFEIVSWDDANDDEGGGDPTLPPTDPKDGSNDEIPF
jgi:hypothetical protein